jgi:hypothetical protein
MKRRLLFIAVALFAFCAASLAQWQFVRAYTPYHAPLKPGDLWGLHGIALDPDGKIWAAPYDASDTLTLGSSANLKRREIFVFDKNGTPASFSPIKTITVGGVTDSLNNNNSGRGIATDNNGNILYSSFNRLYRINYKTGVGMSKNETVFGGSITQASADNAGNIFVARVAADAQPVEILASDFSFLADACSIKTTASIARCLLVSGDGTRVYYPGTFGSNLTNQLYIYENQLGPGFGLYALVDSALQGMQIESIAWQPRSGKKPLLWASSGSRNNPPDTTKWRKNGRVWYGMDTDTKTIVDSIAWVPTFPGNPTYDDTVATNQAARPRGIAFSSTGDTAYVGCFLADSNAVKMFKKLPTSVQRYQEGTPVEYALSQNYPNPFNPSTEIQFSVPKAGLTTLTVYDILGREVATLVNENLKSGSYKTTLDATRLSSGTYIYTLSSNGARISKKMMLLK